MADLLTLTDLELWTRIGVKPEEREAEQRLLVSIDMTVDSRAAAKSDDVKKTINYFDVTQDVKSLAIKERKTIERLLFEKNSTVRKRMKAGKCMQERSFTAAVWA